MDKYNLFKKEEKGQKLSVIPLVPFDFQGSHFLKPAISVFQTKNFVHFKRSRVERPPILETGLAKSVVSDKEGRFKSLANRNNSQMKEESVASASIKQSRVLAEYPPSKTGRSRVIMSPKKQSVHPNQQKIALIKTKCLSNLKANPIRKKRDTDLSQGTNDCKSEDLNSQNETQRKSQPITLQLSPFEGRSPTLFIQYPNCCKMKRQKINTRESHHRFSLCYKMTGNEYNCILNSLKINQFQECDDDWNIYFDMAGTKMKTAEQMNRYQKINHFPGCWYLGRKDFLYKLLSKMKRKFSSEYNFIPNTFIFPTDLDRFQMVRQNSAKDKLWIMKPVNQACGRGIKMITKETRIKRKKDVLVSQYIGDPHLINNLKYDLRLYVLVSSYDPLRIYLFEEGLARFATYQYNTKLRDSTKRYIHLTNYAVNKKSKKFIKDDEESGKGSKWSHSCYKTYLNQHGYDTHAIFSTIKDLIIKTCISAEPNMLDLSTKTVEKRNCCFQLYGFDVLLDSALKPWLMEVNVCPSLASSSAMDRRVKNTLLADTLHLIGIEPYDRKSYQDEKKRQRELRCQSQGPRRQLFSKNIRELDSLSYQNCVDKLKLDDWNILFQSEQEMQRRGHYERIYPTKQNADKYLPYFQFPRYNNVLLSKYYSSQKDFLNQISTRHQHSSTKPLSSSMLQRLQK